MKFHEKLSKGSNQEIWSRHKSVTDGLRNTRTDRLTESLCGGGLTMPHKP